MPASFSEQPALAAASDLQRWIGRKEVVEERITETPAALLAATLDREIALRHGDPLPPLWHWLYFLPVVRHVDLGEDGHAKRGSLLPPIELPRRMWAGSRIEFRRELRTGEMGRRTTTIANVNAKTGRSGSLIFVRIDSQIEDTGGVAIVEERDIVFCGPPPATGTATVPDAPSESDWSRSIVPDPVLLFRYSALTFNCHRIHFDEPYATQVEGYPGLVVHGPLIATLLAELVARRLPERLVRKMSIRSVSPLYAGESFKLAGRAGPRSAQLWAANSRNQLAMSADFELD